MSDIYPQSLVIRSQRDEIARLGRELDAARAAVDLWSRREAGRMTTGNRYRHYRGGTYVEIARATMEATGEAVVVYRGEADGRVWVRPAREFDGTVQVPCDECQDEEETGPCFVDPPVRRFAPIGDGR